MRGWWCVSLSALIGCPAQTPSPSTSGDSSGSGPATEPGVATRWEPTPGSTGRVAASSTSLITGPGDSSTGPNDWTSTGRPETDTADTTTGSGTKDVYGPCSDDGNCAGEAMCVPLYNLDGEQLAGICSVPCVADFECPDRGSLQTVECGENEVCQISCAGAPTCPDGMECYDTSTGLTCVWPT